MPFTKKTSYTPDPFEQIKAFLILCGSAIVLLLLVCLIFKLFSDPLPKLPVTHEKKHLSGTNPLHRERNIPPTG